MKTPHIPVVPSFVRKATVFAAALGALTVFLSPAAAAPGDVEMSFAPELDRSATSTTIQPDGYILIGGNFTHAAPGLNGGLVRLKPDGTFDDLFNPVVTGNPNSVVVLDDGRVVIGGGFTSVGGWQRNKIARLNANGTLDDAFNPNLSDSVYSMAVQADGKIVVCGSFTTTGAGDRSRLLRLNTDGSLDTFNPAANTIVRSLAILPDGRIVIGGNFTTVNSTMRNHVARLSAAGGLDSSFNPNVNGNVYCVALQADGKIVIGGSFTTAGGAARVNLARINTDGTVDQGFAPSANDIVRNIVLQTDGKMVIGGHFMQVNGTVRNRLARLQADGTLDAAFNPGADDVVNSTALQSDGRLITGGEFHLIGGTTRDYLARLQNDPVTQSLSITNNNRVFWARSGAGPESHRVSFDLSTNSGISWTPLGSGTRVAGGWELSGLSLPPNPLIRARARITSGIYNGSSGLIEFTPGSPLERWRQSNFGTFDGTGIAADNADPDKDGLENLVEYAFALNPNAPDAAALPAWERDDDVYLLVFNRPENVSGITYIAEYSTSLAPESWLTMPNAGTAPGFMFYAQPVSKRFYARLRVTAP